MSEYIEIEIETTNDPAVMLFYTNMRLAEEGVELYDSLEDMEEGSAVAQALASIEGIVKIKIGDHTLTVTSDLSVPWHILVGEISAAMKDFFL